MFDPLHPDSQKRHAPATERNREVIWEVLDEVLPYHGEMVEVGSGTGQHVAYFAAQRPSLTWWPVEPDPELRQSIYAWSKEIPSIMAPRDLDVMTPNWAFQEDWERSIDGVFCANLCHIAPWDASVGLLMGAAHFTKPGGTLVIYGPFREKGKDLVQSNAAFDQNLRDRNELWGLRSIENMDMIARKARWKDLDVRPMPANNVMLIWTRS